MGSDVDFSSIPLPKDLKKDSSDEQSETSIEETFLKFKEKFACSMDDYHDYTDQMEGVLKRLSRFCSDHDDDNRISDDDDISDVPSDEATLNSVPSLLRK